MDLEESVVFEVVDLEESVFSDEISDLEDRVMFENVLEKKKFSVAGVGRELHLNTVTSAEYVTATYTNPVFPRRF